MTIPLSKKKLKDEFQRLEGASRICAICKDEEEKLNILSSFLFSGLSINEKTICIVDKNTKERILELSSNDSSHLGKINTHLEFIIEEEIYHHNSDFDPARIIQLIKYIIEKTPRNEYEGFNIITDHSWIFKRKMGSLRISDYKVLLHDIIIENECKSLCLYDESSTNSSMLLDAILSHPLLILQNKICNNILYYDSSFLQNQSESKFSQELYETITHHLLKFDAFDDKNDLIREETQELITKNREKSDILYKDLFENTGTAMILIEDDMTISLANSKCEQLFGYSKKEILGKIKWTDFIVKEDLARMLEYRDKRRNQKGSIPNDYEARVITKSGEIRTVELNISTNPETNLTIVSIKDVTEQHLNHKLIIENEKQYRSIVDTVNESIYDVNREGTIIYQNSKSLEFYGYSSEELIGGKAWKISEPEKVEELQARWATLFETGESFENAESTIIHKDRSKVFIESTGIPIYNEQNEIISYRIFERNITERKQAEELRRKNEEKYRNLFNNAKDAIFLVKVEENGQLSNFLEVNDLACERYGYTREEFLELTPKNINDPENYSELIFDENTLSSRNEIELDRIHITKTGKSFPVNINSHVFEIGDERVVLAIVRDITDRKQTEIELQRSKETLTERVKEISCIYTVSQSLMDSETDQEGKMRKIISEIETAWQYPEITKVRISFGGLSYSSDNFVETEWKQISHVEYNNETIGTLEVFYSQEKPVSYEGPFLKEERDLIDEIACLISGYITRTNMVYELEQSETFYRSIFETSSAAYCIFNADGTIEKISSQFEIISGYSKSELEGKRKWMSLIPQPELDIMLGYNKKRISDPSSAPIQYETKILNKNNLKKDILITVDLIPEINKFMVSAIEITERKQTEFDLKESESKYRTYVENFVGIAFRGTIDFKPIYFHGAVMEITGYEEENFVEGELRWDELILEEDKHIPLSIAEEIKTKLNFKSVIEYRIRRKDGEIRWIRQHVQNLEEELNGIRLVQGSLYDITNEKSATEALKESETKYKTLIETSPDAVLMTDLEGNMTFANQQTAELLGYNNAEELLRYENSINSVRYFDEESLVDLRDNLNITYKKGSVKDFEYTMVKADGTKFPAEITTALMTDETGPYAVMAIGRDITERKHVANELLKSEEKSRRIVENSPIGILTATLEGEVISANQAAVLVFGYNSEESFKSSVNTVGIEKKLYANPTRRKEIINLISEADNWLINENNFMHKDGTIITLSLRSHIISDLEGNKIIESFFEDVTEKKKFEQEKEIAVNALVESEEKLRLLNEELEEKVKQRTSQMETLYSLIRDVSLTFNLKEAMGVIAKYLSNFIDCDIIAQVISQEGLNHIHIEGPSVDPVIYEQFIDKIKEDFALLNPDVFDNRDNISVIKNKNALFDKIHTNISIPLVAEDKIVGFISVGSSEVDAYNEDEIWFLYRIADNISHTLQRLQIILTAKEELETVLNHTSDGIILLSNNKQIVLSNIVGEVFLKSLNLKQGDLFENSLVNFDALIEVGKLEIIVYDKIYQSELAEIKTDFLHGWGLTIREVTEERGMQKKIVQQERLAIIGQLTGGIAHDFNNMLASIIGAADFALMNSDSSLESKELLNLIIRQSERGASLVRQMLDFTRQSVISPKPIDVQNFLMEFSRVARASLPTSIALNSSNTNSTVFMDQIQLQQLLMNLMINSRDSMPIGGEISLVVKEVSSSEVVDFEEIEINQEHDYVNFIVKDDGEGMDELTLKKAFEPFFTTKAPGKGSGLGLAQVYGIIRQSKGYISIKSDIGKGTEIHLFLPKYLGEIKVDVIEDAIPGLGRILLVEDDDDVREITKIMLENYGYEVVAAENGKLALELYNANFDLVLTDIIMPIMGGEELISELRKMNPHVRCMVMTGYADVKVPDDITVIYKPMTSSKLVNHVQKVLDNFSIKDQKLDKETAEQKKENK